MPRPYEFPGGPLLVILSVALSACLAPLFALPASASAYATIAPPPIYSTAPGLPDGRVYEQVSPTDKNGNQAGASTNEILHEEGRESRYAVAATDGNAVLFEGTGPMGETASPLTLFFVAQRSVAGWRTRAAMPRPQQSTEEFGGVLNSKPNYIDPSADLSHVMVQPGVGRFATTAATCGKNQLYLAGPDPFVPATWLEQPEIPDPIEDCAVYDQSGAPVGGTPDFSTVYFTVPGTVLPEDASRVPHATGGENGGEAWGFYEDREGALREAGVLPDGGLDPFGAVPAVSGRGKARAGNEVSADGSRAFFVSPDPGSCKQVEGENDCAVDPPQLYVRENGERTLLVSRDTLLPEVGGLPVPAPDGALRMPNPAKQAREVLSQYVNGSYVFASIDGSQAFFRSEDDLTEPAEEASPGAEPKTYDFDVNTGALTYLPGVVGQILATDADGSSLAFVRPAAGSSPAQFDLWSAGPDGGSVTPITQLPDAGAEPVRMSSDGSVVVFTAEGLPGFNDAGVEEIFRYDAPANTLGCVSCAPAGVTPSSAGFSQMLDDERSTGEGGMVDERGVSADGSRVFFETRAALVPQDADGLSNVYEWENGVVYLISSGKSMHNSYFLDNSENGSDVFFATTDGLVPGDTDGAYDVYDARVPHPGDNPPPAAVPCEGSVCQGPPRVPTPLAAPASATFSGLGDVAPESALQPAAKPKSTPKATKCDKGFVRKRNKCVKRKAKRSTHGKGSR